jgi:hypothetical protein
MLPADNGAESGAESEQRASGERAESERSGMYYVLHLLYIPYICIYILYCNVLDMQCVLINLCHMYVVVSIVTEKVYFNA